MALLGIIPTSQTSFMARHRILMRFHTTIVPLAVRSETDEIVRDTLEPFHHAGSMFPSERQVRGGDDLDEILIVEGRGVGRLLRVVEWVHVMV